MFLENVPQYFLATYTTNVCKERSGKCDDNYLAAGTLQKHNGTSSTEAEGNAGGGGSKVCPGKNTN